MFVLAWFTHLALEMSVLFLALCGPGEQLYQPLRTWRPLLFCLTVLISNSEYLFSLPQGYQVANMCPLLGL